MEAATKSFLQSGYGVDAIPLRNHDKIFAMLVDDRLVVKLPAKRVDAFVTAGRGERFDPRHDGRLMKEWLVVAISSDADWLSLAEEAMTYVGSRKTGV